MIVIGQRAPYQRKRCLDDCTCAHLHSIAMTRGVDRECFRTMRSAEDREQNESNANGKTQGSPTRYGPACINFGGGWLSERWWHRHSVILLVALVVSLNSL